MELLNHQTYKGTLELIVTVDGSTDGTQDMLRNEGIRFFDTGNTGTNTVARSRNLGLKAARGDMVIMQDEDCLPHPQMVEKYVNNFSFGEVQLGYKAMDEDYLKRSLPVPVESGGDMAIWWKNWQENKFRHFETGSCAMSLEAARTQAKDGSSGFDERFEGYGWEDIEYGRRLLEAGYRIVFNTEAVCCHKKAMIQQQDKASIKDTKLSLDAIMGEPWPVYPGFADTPGHMGTTELSWLYQRAREMRSVLEVGSWQGRSTHALATGCPGKVYAVDPWRPEHIRQTVRDFVEGHDGHLYSWPLKALDNMTAFLHNTRRFNNLRTLRMTSLEAAELFRDRSLDMVLIDGDHDYYSVNPDILAWLPKTVKLICGHDYVPGGHPGVVKAVDEIFGKVGHYETIWFKELS